jgi:signal transduction histidine kinase
MADENTRFFDSFPNWLRALADDAVAEASENLAEELPPRYARFAGITTITCTPVSAGGHWLGVIFADRGGGRFTLTFAERQTMWTLGKLAALTASVQQATHQRETSKRLTDRISLIREIHEGVIQRLFGLLLVLGSEQELDAEQRRVCHDELRAVLGELRGALGRSLTVPAPSTRMTTRQILERIGTIRSDLHVAWAPEVVIDDAVEPTAQAVVLEAIRNAEKHARPTRIDVTVGVEDGAFVLEVVNDGAGAGAPGTGLGLRLATIEALQHNGILEFGPVAPDRWHVRLVIPQP